MPELMRFVRGGKCVAIAILAAALLACIAPAQARDVRCTIYQDNRIAFDGPCNFEADGRDGSFTLSARRTGGVLLPDISMISVSMISSGVAEVRGLTRQGINSRWGEAKRSPADRACWHGSDFQVCARSP